MMMHNNISKPPWLRVRLPATPEFAKVVKTLSGLRLNTVCVSARCPNIFECFSRKKATFMILGSSCTRNCGFCAVSKDPPETVDHNEPQKISEAVSILGLRHIVLTSVTRDDLKDGGALHFARVLNRLGRDHQEATLEVLVPDFGGRLQSIDRVLESGPHVFGHNLETVSRLYLRARPQADYRTSLQILQYVSDAAPEVPVKTGIMAGLGESDAEILQALEDIAGSGCKAVTVGQYLRPSRSSLEVRRYVPPEKFTEYEEAGIKLGLVMSCGPLIRSSYRAESLGLRRS